MKRYTILFLLLFLALIHAFSQEQKISGVVTDAENGDPLPGVSVMVEGTEKGWLPIMKENIQF
ncbi:MAG: carboxypeptidase-like regulatory domain-containing protein [Bacteroidales bacterium]|nr:carboxypeptidase-like regulatory domain-containing protein [Bacteroidales bacterium]